ncbi:hypothetical protein PHYPSEUDO_013289 [Phytophthora pseudosyringae]|uniref:MSV199 domain-containing protein n=1 Tax=Phytophthora pseudosyringae TaxID=221518 RepID=A0A8T1V5G2_9STRA|nr:hypothetical protein PHYPSEUDO_013289 [Phytophthora pseudosyringae]
MALTYNSIDLAFDQQSPLELMDIYQFVKTFQYPIEQLYIDKFWNGINKNDWIVVDYDMLRWMGYESGCDDIKKQYHKLLQDNKFIQSTDYGIVTNDELGRDLNVPLDSNSSEVRKEPSEHIIDSGAQKDIIVVRARFFKESLMMLHTKRAETILKYYLLLEAIVMEFMRYAYAVKEHNSVLTIQSLQKQIETGKELPFEISSNPIQCNEYVYVLTNKRYYREHMFKIGKSINPKNRLISYNTGSAFCG